MTDIVVHDARAGREATPGGPAADLRCVGVTAFDESVYRYVLGTAEATPDVVAAGLGCTATRALRALERLREAGLVSRLAGRSRRYTATRPDTAIETLVRSHAAALDRVRVIAGDLAAVYAARQQSAEDTSVVSLLNDAHELGRVFVQLQHEVRDEMLVIDRPPYALAPTNPIEPVSLAQGVRWRAIYAPESLEREGALEEVERLAAEGEVARVLPGLPLKLAIADRETALMPLDLELGSTQAVVIRRSTLLDGLVALFETYWRQAVPLGRRHRVPDLSPDEVALGRLLAAGLTDTAIARQLGWSTRTMRRRVSALMKKLPAATRFQAGAQAERGGWL